MREKWFYVFFIFSVHSTATVVRKQDLRVEYNDQEYMETNNENNDAATSEYYYYYYDDDTTGDDQNGGSSPDYPTIVTTFAPVVLLTNVPFSIWTYVPETRNPTQTPTLAVPTLRPSSPIPTVSPAPSPYPTLAPTRLTSSPTVPAPTRSPTFAPSRPTVDPTYAPSATPTTAQPTTLTPTSDPTQSPTRAPITDTDPPTYSPTALPELWELGFPKSFSKSVDSVMLNIGIVAILLWLSLLVYWVIASYRHKKWTFQGFYDSLQSSTHSHQNKSSTPGYKRRKIVKNKYEDYWGEDSEDNSLSNFPIRNSTLGTGYGYGTGRSISLISPADSKTVPSHEDYWDENIDFSIRSSDSFGLK